MRSYFTGLLPYPDEPKLKNCLGRGWEAFSGPARSKHGEHLCGKPYEIVIWSSNATMAQKALNLIKTAHELINGAPDMFGVQLQVIPHDKAEYQRLFPNPNGDRAATISTSGFPDACRLAAKASKKRAYTYALALYHVSQSIHSNHPMDLEHDLRSDQHRSPLPHDHVRFAYAIVTAYAVLEQLGLALYGEAFQNGKWIPAKRTDLEHRLVRAGFNLAESALWQLRGGRTMLERRRKTQALKKTQWARGLVRDEEVDVVDAIADLRWLRSGVAAHDVKDLARLLSVFDVANAQYLARRSILACLGLEQK